MDTPSAVSVPENGRAWKERSRVVLTPVAAPAVLGWSMFAIAAMLVGSRFADLWGGELTLVHLAPFLLALGIGQLVAAMWGFRAREPIATLVHGAWGCLWLGVGMSYTFSTFGVLELVSLRMPLGFLLVGVGIVTLSVTIAAVFENALLTLLTGLVTIAAVLSGIGLMSATNSVIVVGGWVMLAAAACAWYLATAILVAEATGRQRLPLGDYRMTTDLPGEPTTHAVAYNTGMPLLRATAGRERRERVNR